MLSASFLNASHLGSSEKHKKMKASVETDSEGNHVKKTLKVSVETDAEGNLVPEVEDGARTRRIDPPCQNISIRYGSIRYNVKMEPDRKMRRVMKKLAKMVGKQVEELVLKKENSGKVVTGEETMKEFVGEVLVVQ